MRRISWIKAMHAAADRLGNSESRGILAAKPWFPLQTTTTKIPAEQPRLGSRRGGDLRALSHHDATAIVVDEGPSVTYAHAVADHARTPFVPPWISDARGERLEP
jgi:hypothetical protein